MKEMRRPHLLILGAWLVHSVAWFLPVVHGGVTLPKGLPGWQAFRVAACAVWPYEDFRFDEWYAMVLGTVSAVTTLLFILGSPWIALGASRWLRRVSAWVAASAFVVNAHWLFQFGVHRRWYVFLDLQSSDLRIGYFLWWFSFALLAAGLFDLARADMADESPGNHRL